MAQIPRIKNKMQYQRHQEHQRHLRFGHSFEKPGAAKSGASGDFFT